MSANNETNPEMKHLDEEEGRVQPVENRGKIFGISKTLFISLVALFGVLAVAISVGALVTSSGPSKRDCKGDTFEVVKYNYSDATSGQHGERFLKYKFVEDEKYDDFYEFTKAKERCHNLSSTLWEIQDGQVEWETLIAIAKKLKSEAMWINAEPEGLCEDGAEVCHEPEAIEGKGLAVRWPSFPRLTYSRLYKPATPDKKCIKVNSRHQELLWMTDNCKTSTAAALCVKRDCEVE